MPILVFQRNDFCQSLRQFDRTIHVHGYNPLGIKVLDFI